MNTLKFYPEKFRNLYMKNIMNSKDKLTPEKRHNRIVVISFAIATIFLTFFYFYKISLLYSLLVFLLVNIFYFFLISLKASSRIKKMEHVFPDVISLMASNLRAGITIDKSFLLAARPEFYPLDEEILKAGKEIATGKEVIYSLKMMSDKIASEKISKIVYLIISGLKAGGNISDLLEETSKNMKEKEVLEKKAASSILMYSIFIFFAVGVGAPLLFGLSSVLVEIVIELAKRIPEGSAGQINLPISFNKISISPKFVIYFSMLFIIVTDFISCFVIGLVNKGEEKSGLKLFIPLLILSITIFVLVRLFLSNMLFDAIKII